MSTPEIISYYGYPVEIITVTTDDGYILALHRIPFGKNETKKTRNPNRPVIFLQHGLLASSADFVANLPHQSLGFMLADAGFDVWLGNSRGNFYSQRHTKFDSNSPAFWNFTWDEIVAYDMPAQVNRVLEITGASSLHYVGHSQGTMVMFARLANYPDFHSKIKSFFALAPVATVGNIKGLLRIISDHFQKELRWLIEMQGEHQFLPTTWFSRMTARIICGTFAMLNPLCQNILFQIGGPENKQFNVSRIMVYMSHTPAGTSTSNILHWAQMVQSGKTQMFDYGSAQKNLWRYGQETPPAYNMSTFVEPTYLYYGDADCFYLIGKAIK
ncbi:unnamed protein product, partial [Mesorhabditis belari]|uniref:Partial AB-hydrolase lipase domain-containing protein n=1 Tax=Mesorhabditis belari TaxID=2138241 RepID=A0AAF3FDA3_9BILA